MFKQAHGSSGKVSICEEYVKVDQAWEVIDKIISTKKFYAALYYSGHGTKKKVSFFFYLNLTYNFLGAWSFSDWKITPREEIERVYNEFKGRFFWIYSDSCYSGHWCKTLK